MIVRFDNKRNPEGKSIAEHWQGFQSFGRNGWAKTTGLVVSVTGWSPSPVYYPKGAWRLPEVQISPVTSRGAAQALQISMPVAAMIEMSAKFLLLAGADPDTLKEALTPALCDGLGQVDLERWLQEAEQANDARN